MAEERKDRGPGALTKNGFKVLSMRPVNKDEPTRKDGSLTPAIARIELDVLIKGSDDIAFLNGNEFDSAKDLASGFVRIEPQSANPDWYNVTVGGIRKWTPKPAATA